eukprot:TRINITY_DN14542_c0_g1_i1.p1 TRINITY_DN14542_c0_g1~~TRINITY_DN14542_c0_g1_i1.p1  ORF type:complete len:352 (+),score=13.93 TRINITY_DN14542_c0_g1_i1:65-1120(+)
MALALSNLHIVVVCGEKGHGLSDGDFRASCKACRSEFTELPEDADMRQLAEMGECANAVCYECRSTNATLSVFPKCSTGGCRETVDRHTGWILAEGNRCLKPDCPHTTEKYLLQFPCGDCLCRSHLEEAATLAVSFRNLTKDIHGAYNLQCPGGKPECGHLRSIHALKVLGKELYENFKRVQLEQLQATGHYRLCPHCKLMVELNDSQFARYRATAKRNSCIVSCPRETCKKRFCVNCAHPETGHQVTCDDEGTLWSDIDPTTGRRHVRGRRCRNPACQAMILRTRDDTRSHRTVCPHCTPSREHWFCWNCYQSDWPCEEASCGPRCDEDCQCWPPHEEYVAQKQPGPAGN